MEEFEDWIKIEGKAYILRMKVNKDSSMYAVELLDKNDVRVDFTDFFEDKRLAVQQFHWLRDQYEDLGGLA